MTSLAPIGLSTYGRLSHLQQTVGALRQNLLAAESDLFIFSDAPRPGDEAKVAAVRDYLRTVDGFRHVTVVERQSNNRVYNNRQGMRQLLDSCGRMIFLEEDVVTAPRFLSFMNQALEMYKDNPHVMTISGYCPPIKIPTNYQHDVFFLRRFNAWGFGIWRDRFDLIEMDSAPGYARLLADRRLRRDFSRYGADLLETVRMDAGGEWDALDVKVNLSQFFLDRYTVYPTGSLVRNIGIDGSGLHCGDDDRFDVTHANGRDNYRLPELVEIDQRIVRYHARFCVPVATMLRNRLRWFETRIRKAIRRTLFNR